MQCHNLSKNIVQCSVFILCKLSTHQEGKVVVKSVVIVVAGSTAARVHEQLLNQLGQAVIMVPVGGNCRGQNNEVLVVRN